ncbi:sigma factor-like helix-turn-helix DNA-binding protein [Sorangium sp. So ce834]|uniref:sigma factor-like helix-turn-helix DNA-binding protein n=1 Tax=Sorangium sp. So ce834 TaxID=3133321 RepID=UPI003F5D95E8
MLPAPDVWNAPCRHIRGPPSPPCARWLRRPALAPEHRTLLLDRHVEEIPMAEIAKRRGLPRSTAYKHHARALAALVELAQLAREGEPR